MLTEQAYILLKNKKYFESSDFFFKLGHLIGFDQVQMNLNLIQETLLSQPHTNYRYNNDIYIQLLFTNNINSNYTFQGISVIVPVYNAESYISSCVQSLLSQTLEKSKFEIIFVINGERDKSYDIIKKMITEENICVKILYISVGNVSIARNVGINYAFKQYFCFLDADDYLEKDFLQSAFYVCNNNTVVLTDIKNIKNGDIQPNSYSMSLQANYKKMTYLNICRFFFLNACKIVPKSLAVDIKFEESLKTGEDTVFWMSFLSRNHRILELASTYGKPYSAYIHVLTPDSLSRKDESFDFSIIQHIGIITHLRNICSDDHIVQTLINQRIDTQIENFVISYLKNNMCDFDKAVKYIESAGEFETIEYIRRKLQKSP